MSRPILLLMAALLLFPAGAVTALADEPPVPAADEASAGAGWDPEFRFTLRNLTFGLVQKPVATPLNPGNVLELNRYQLESDFRPDLQLLLPRLDLSVKPRLELRWDSWEERFDETRSGEDADLFVHEWLVRAQPLDDLFLSYGREDLQWGPAYLLSPSNPFYTDNGRQLPKQEVRAADYARLVWVPRHDWSVSAIANTDEGRKDPRGDFDPAYAVKLDRLGEQGQASLILARRESGHTRTGLYGSWNVSEAVILYGEGSVAGGRAEALAGGSYTFADGGMLSLEYFYNGAGSGNAPLRALALTRDARTTLLRRNYALAQYYYQPPLGDWNVLLRATFGLDDDSQLLLGHGEYNLGEHAQLFATMTLFSGDRDTEFGSLLDYRTLLGVEWTF